MASVSSAEKVAAGLGYAGLLPFFAGLALLWYPPMMDVGVRALTLYAAVILTFVGAVHWGMSLNSDHPARASVFVLSVLPSLAAWCFALLLSPAFALLALAVAFVFWWWKERSVLNATLPGWYLRLRNHLTLAVTLVLLAGSATRYLHALP